MTNSPFLQTIEQILEKKGLKRDQVLQIFYQASRSFEMIGLKEEAAEIYEKCVRESKEINNTWLYFLSSIHLAQVYATLGNWNRVTTELNGAKELLEQIKDYDRVEYYLAESFTKLYRGNIEHTYHTLSTVNKDLPLRGIQRANVLITIGNTHIDLEEYEKAIEYYQEALELSSGNPLSQGSAAINLALALVLAGKLDEARKYIDQAKDIAEKYNFKPLLGIVYLNESKYFLKSAKYDRALELLDFAMGIFRDTKDSYYQIGVKINRAKVYQAMGDEDKARQEIQEALQESRDMGYKLREAEVYEVLAEWGEEGAAEKAAEIHKDLGNIQKADKILQKFGK